MSKKLKIALIVFVVFCCKTHANQVNVEERELYLSQIESFFDDIKAMNARFIEVSSTKGIASGVFMIMRPYMKVKYETPHQNVIVADGQNLYHWDCQLEEQSKYDITSSPVAAILSKKLNLRKNTIVKAVKQDSAKIWINLSLTAYSGVKSIVLVFTKKPFCLIQWILINDRNDTVEVTLQDVNLKAKLNQADFSLK
ncbi:MAG: outer membrane lipoprotein carrier protein LolA [Holosporales bacterium]|jgi:outer membrane lipoprotein-sorting protein|nr:outer membrane lipoprotein carrier protein LolA [Holosporales bacterium]